jgi:putative oxidoreductase
MKLSIEIRPRSLLNALLAVILAWAAISKISNLQEFYSLMLGYRLPIPAALLRFTAFTLPWLELITGILLFVEGTRAAALAWSCALFALFSVVTLQAWLRGLHINCGCLDLSLVGIRPDSALASALESAGFAFVRAVVLEIVAVCLFVSRAPAPAP